MSYVNDLVFQVIQKIRTPSEVEPMIARAWSNWSGKPPLSVQLEPGLTNYKPFERARIMAKSSIFIEDVTEPVKFDLFFQIFAAPDRTWQEAKIGWEQDLFCGGPPVFLIPDWQTAVWTLPNAPNLRELGQLLNSDKFCQLLNLELDIDHYPAPKLFRYVPLKRALLTWEHPETHHRYFAKLYNDTDYPEVSSNFQQVAEVAKEGQLGFAVPQPVSYNSTDHTLVMTEVSGCQFTEIMRHAIAEPFAQVGRVLAQLHSSCLMPEKIWTPDRELVILDRHLQGASLALPELKTPLDWAIDILDNLAQKLSFIYNLPIHGNLFGDQILYSANGIGIVDWDALSLGDPLYDLGRLIAHLIYLGGVEGIAATQVNVCAEALIQSYEKSTAQIVDRKCLNWHITIQLLLRGKISSLRKLPEGWQNHMAFVVAESQRLLSGQSNYISLPALQQGLLCT